jgi:hypothetical protein
MAFLDDCCSAVKRWLSLLGITDRVQVKVGKLEPHVCASTWTNPDYLEALIVFNDPAVSGPYDLEEVAAHEVFHIPMAGFQTKSGTRERSEEERVVERFSRAFVALWRGTPFANRVALAPTLRAIIGQSRKARHRLAVKRRVVMPEELIALMMAAGEAAGREDVPEDVKELLRKLAAAAVTGDAPPASEAEPDNAPPAAEADPKPEDEPPPPAMRAGLSEKARKALDAADAKAEEALALAKKRVSLEIEATRQTLFTSAPDVFGGHLAKRREIYKAAPLDEIERYIESERVKRAPADSDPKARKNVDHFREPPTGASGITTKNPGGFSLKGGN